MNSRLLPPLLELPLDFHLRVVIKVCVKRRSIHKDDLLACFVVGGSAYGDLNICCAAPQRLAYNEV